MHDVLNDLNERVIFAFFTFSGAFLSDKMCIANVYAGEEFRV